MTTDTSVHRSAFGCITLPFVIVMCVVLGWGARSNWMRGQLARDGIVVPGQVTELRFVAGNTGVVRSTRSRNARGESPVVAFTTRTGEARTAIGSVNRRPAPWAVGDTVDIVYDPANPTRVDLLSEVAGWRVWFGIWCGVALVPFAVALLPVVLRMRQHGRRLVK